MGIIRRVSKKVKRIKSNLCFNYINFCKEPLDDKSILLEAGQGGNINGSMFTLVCELKKNPKWKEYKVAFVVTTDTLNDAKSRMEAYGFDDVKLTVRLSKEYNKLLATSKYLATDNSFPPYFSKRSGQVFLNTWHGTPLKTLGASDKSSFNSPANIQKNYLMSDYALFPNEFTRDVFFDDYYLRHIYKNNVLIMNYPRNEVFYDKEQGVRLKKELKLDGYKTFAYMPTWRGSSRVADVEEQIAIITKYLKQIDKKMKDDQIFFVNLHFLVNNSIDYSKFKHIRKFPAEYETYEFLNTCDVLVTDYSSVFFDYAVTGKKIVLFAYDKEEYLHDRGTYIPFEELPFPITETVNDLVKELNSDEISNREDFLKTYSPNGNKHISEDVLDLVINGKSDGLNVYKNKEADIKADLIFDGKFGGRSWDFVSNYVSENKYDYYIFAFRGNLSKKKVEFINSLPKNVIPLGTITAYQFTFAEMLNVAFSKIFKKAFNIGGCLSKFFAREKDRLLCTINPVHTMNFSNKNKYYKGILDCYDCPHDEKYIPSINDYTAKNIFPHFYNKKGTLNIISSFEMKSLVPFALNDIEIEIFDKVYKPNYYCTSTQKVSKKHKGIWKITIPFEDAKLMAQNNPVFASFGFGDDVEEVVRRRVYFNKIWGRRSIASRGPAKIDKDDKIIACFRQVAKNRMNLFVRDLNITDAPIEQFKLTLSFILSKFMLKNNIIYLFEKEGSRYEESASVLYEKLIDAGYNNAYFLITKDYPYLDDIDPKYRKNLIYKGTWKHYLYFFKSKLFIGSEAMAHALDITVLNRIALKKVLSKNISYVFLQHGVMYMISLDSPSRKFFKRKNLKGKYRVVVSSREEADHFTRIGNHLEENMYICGLPKYDNNYKYDDADQIVIMPTWRPWEANEFQVDLENSKYYKMLVRIVDAIPKEYHDKIVILPHPLLVKRLEKSNSPLKDKMLADDKYDNILRKTALLITDYSSIAYDAYYRGAQIIFYWEEKDECLENYGVGTKLLLNEENTFAPVAYNQEELTKAFSEVYMKPHSKEMQAKYDKIVQFHDGKNTERLIAMLKKDKLI